MPFLSTRSLLRNSFIIYEINLIGSIGYLVDIHFILWQGLPIRYYWILHIFLLE